MNTRILAGLSAIGMLAIGAGGYWLGSRGHGSMSDAAQVAAAGSGTTAPRKVLYYRNPMGLPDTSPVPKKDPMGMDYVPVYEGEDSGEPAAANTIKISTDKVQKLGVRTEAAKMLALDKLVRSSGRIEIDERRQFAISPKFEGYVERLLVNVTGQPVAKGQALFEVYAPELVSAQREYAIAAQGADTLKGAGSETHGGMVQLAEASLLRLRNWDVPEEQIKALAKTGNVSRTLTFRSPVSGVVTEKKALQGMRFMPGDALYQIADLSSVWVIADVFEQDIGRVRTGAKARVKINAYPDKTFEGTVSYVYPTLQASTRTIPVRIELPNPGQLLKPAMFAQVEIPVSASVPVLVVPNSAVIDSGTRQIVLIQKAEGRYEPREVKLGARSDNYVEVRDGVQDGEAVVVSANFLIDAESNLKAAVGGFGHAAHGTNPSAKPAAQDGAQAGKVGHHGEGSVDSIDAKAGTLSLNHKAIESLKWPAMTMEFKLANVGLLQGLKPGDAVSFEFVERSPGEWVVTQIKPAGGMPPGMVMPAEPTTNAHSGH